MTRRPFVVALAPLALAALALGCLQEPNVPKIGTPVIELSMAFKSTTFQIGRPDTITVTATSNFSERARLLFNTDCQILLTIRSATGAAVVPPNGRHTCLQIATSLDIPANGTVTRRFVWAGTTEFIPPGSVVALPAGSYFVSASINATNYSTFAPAVRVDLTTP